MCVCVCCVLWLSRLLHHFTLGEPTTLIPLCTYNPFSTSWANSQSHTYLQRNSEGSQCVQWTHAVSLVVRSGSCSGQEGDVLYALWMNIFILTMYVCWNTIDVRLEPVETCLIEETWFPHPLWYVCCAVMLDCLKRVCWMVLSLTLFKVMLLWSRNCHTSDSICVLEESQQVSPIRTSGFGTTDWLNVKRKQAVNHTTSDTDIWFARRGEKKAALDLKHIILHQIRGQIHCTGSASSGIHLE